MNILDQQKDLEGFSDQMLVQEGQQPTGQYAQFIVASEMERRRKLRERYKAQKAQAELKKPSVIEQRMQELQGIPSVDPSLQMQEQQMQEGQMQEQQMQEQQMQEQQMRGFARGGIVGYAHGGPLPSRLPENDDKIKKLLAALGLITPENTRAKRPYLDRPNYASDLSIDAGAQFRQDRPSIIPFDVGDGRTEWRPPNQMLPSPPGIREIPRIEAGAPDLSMPTLRGEEGVIPNNFFQSPSPGSPDWSRDPAMMEALGPDLSRYIQEENEVIPNDFYMAPSPGRPDGMFRRPGDTYNLDEVITDDLYRAPNNMHGSGRIHGLPDSIGTEVGGIATDLWNKFKTMGSVGYDPNAEVSASYSPGGVGAREAMRSMHTGQGSEGLTDAQNAGVDEAAEMWREYAVQGIDNVDTVGGVRGEYEPLVSDALAQLGKYGGEQDYDQAALDAFRVGAGNKKDQFDRMAEHFRGRVQDAPSGYEIELAQMRQSPEERSRERKALALSGLGALIGGQTQLGQIAAGMAPLTRDIMSLNREQRSDDKKLMSEINMLENVREERNFQATTMSLQNEGWSEEAASSVTAYMADQVRSIAERTMALEGAVTQARTAQAGAVSGAIVSDASTNATIAMKRSDLDAQLQATVKNLVAKMDAEDRFTPGTISAVIDALGKQIRAEMDASFGDDDTSKVDALRYQQQQFIKMFGEIASARSGVPMGRMGTDTAGPGAAPNIQSMIR